MQCARKGPISAMLRAHHEPCAESSLPLGETQRCTGCTWASMLRPAQGRAAGSKHRSDMQLLVVAPSAGSGSSARLHRDGVGSEIPGPQARAQCHLHRLRHMLSADLFQLPCHHQFILIPRPGYTTCSCLVQSSVRAHPPTDCGAGSSDALQPTQICTLRALQTRHRQNTTGGRRGALAHTPYKHA